MRRAPVKFALVKCALVLALLLVPRLAAALEIQNVANDHFLIFPEIWGRSSVKNDDGKASIT